MSNAAVRDYARKECIMSLAIVENAGGKDVANMIVDAHLQAIATYLKGSIGAKAACEVFYRFADEIIAPSDQSRRTAP
jgi:hypothetical protein